MIVNKLKKNNCNCQKNIYKQRGEEGDGGGRESQTHVMERELTGW